jgi:hypothetical protein
MLRNPQVSKDAYTGGVCTPAKDKNQPKPKPERKTKKYSLYFQTA